jgi:hypothetical protein
MFATPTEHSADEGREITVSVTPFNMALLLRRAILTSHRASISLRAFWGEVQPFQHPVTGCTAVANVLLLCGRCTCATGTLGQGLLPAGLPNTSTHLPSYTLPVACARLRA